MISAAVHLLTWRQFIVLQQRQVRDATRRLQCHNHRPCWRRVLLLHCNSVCRHLGGESAENFTERQSTFVLCKKMVSALAHWQLCADKKIHGPACCLVCMQRRRVWYDTEEAGHASLLHHYVYIPVYIPYVL